VPLRSVAPELRVPDFFLVLRGLTAEHDPRCPGGKALIVEVSPSVRAGRIESLLRTRAPEQALRVWRCARSYLEEAPLPAGEANRLSALAVELADGAIAAGDSKLAVRYLSAATLLAGEPPRLRLRTETLRARLLGSPP
jgi:hypothetical protein